MTMPWGQGKMDINIHLAAFRRCQMIEESDAIEIATRFLKARQVVVERFSAATYDSEEQIWACCFEKQSFPLGAVDAPGVIIVEVNCMTGEPGFFDVL